MIVAIDNRIIGFKEEGVDTDRLDKGLFAVRNRFHTLFHEVDVAKIRQESARINNDLAKLDNVLQKIHASRQQRKKIGAAVVAGALLAALLFHLLKKTYD